MGILLFVLMCFASHKISPLIINYETEKFIFFSTFAGLLKLIFVSIVALGLSFFTKEPKNIQ